MLDICIRIQIIVISTCKMVQFISIYLISPFFLCWHYFMAFSRKLKSNHNASNHDSELEPGSEFEHDMRLDMSCYVLNLEGEEGLPEWIMKNITDAMDRMIKLGRKQQPKYLIELLKKSTGFNGVAEFDNNQVPSLYSEQPPNCWALPVVTLTSIAIALPNIDNQMVDRLLHSVSEGLLYVNLVEKQLYTKGDLIKIQEATDIMWLGVDLFRKWMDEDLRKMALEGKTSTKTLEKLSNIAKNIVMGFQTSGGNIKENPLNWPTKIIVANSMYRISQTVLLDYEGKNDKSDEKLFEQLAVIIADILGACLTNIPRVIMMKCFCNSIEKREEVVSHAARLLGETEEILKILQQHELPSFDPDQVACVDEWRALIMQENPLAFTASSNDDNDSSFSDEMRIEIDQEA